MIPRRRSFERRVLACAIVCVLGPAIVAAGYFTARAKAAAGRRRAVAERAASGDAGTSGGVDSRPNPTEGPARRPFVDLARATLVGRVVTAADGASVADAAVWATDVDGAALGVGRTDAEGRFRLAVLTAAAATVRAAASGFAEARSEDVVAAENAEVAVPELRLQRPRTLRGRLLTTEGDPVHGGSMRLEPAVDCGTANARFADALLRTSKTVAIAGTRADGSFEFPGVPGSGAFVAVGAAPGRAAASTSILRFQEGVAAADIELRLAAARRLTGRVTRFAGEAVEGAVVVALVARGRDDAFDAAAAVAVARATTDAAGRFALDGVAPGTPLLVKATGLPIVSTVPSDGESMEIVLGGPVLVRGKVLAEPGRRPLAGVSVSADVFAARPSRLWTSTDREGRFELRVSAGAQVFLTARAPGFAATSTDRDGLFMPDDGDGPFERVDGPPKDGVLEIGLVVGGEAVVRGRVLSTPDGAALEGAVVEARADGRVIASAVADADGAFTLTNLPARNVEIGARLDGWFDATQREPAHGRIRELREGENIPTDVDPWSHRLRPGEVVADVALTLARGADVEGIVQTADGVPVAGAFVEWRRVEADRDPGFGFFDAAAWAARSRRVSGATDAAGRFRLRGVPLAAGLLRATHVAFDAPAEADCDAATASDAGFRLVLAHGGSVEGRVVHPDGKPAAGLELHLVREPAADGAASTQASTPLSAIADDAGAFSFKGLAPGGWRLTRALDSSETNTARRRRRPLRAASESLFVPSSVRNLRVRSREATSVEIRLLRAASISGNVRDAAGGAVPDALVAVMDGDASHADGAELLARSLELVSCDAAGAFRIDGLHPERSYVVVAASFESSTADGVAMRTFTKYGTSDVVRAGAADVAVVLMESKSK